MTLACHAKRVVGRAEAGKAVRTGSAGPTQTVDPLSLLVPTRVNLVRP